ncbi:MAG: hypothetical protein PHN44_05140 [Candidatus Marinimicrobia bacterium]|nr:hypothetical protein [Candidatus Neomarinimicrobiota bacterium]
MTITKKLAAFREAGKAWLDQSSKHSTPLIECLGAYYAFIRNGAYPYHSSVVPFMREYLKMGEEWDDVLKTQTYLCSQFVRLEEKQKEINKMEEKGFFPFVLNALDDKLKTAKTVDIILEGTGEMFFARSEKKNCRVVVTDNDIILLPPRCTRNGYSVGQLGMRGHAYYRITT